jgi:hypothetical protein
MSQLTVIRRLIGHDRIRAILEGTCWSRRKHWDNMKQSAAILVLQYWCTILVYHYFTSIFQYLQYCYRYW